MKLLKTILTALSALLTGTVCFGASGTTVRHPDWSRNAVIYEVNVRQMTDAGTFRALEAQLPRLKELGVDILWLMPVHPISELNRKGTLGSYYAVKDYKAVNPEFGTMDDFKSVVRKAHDLGMKVIIDWVPNHSGCDNAWVTEHPDWYARNEEGKMFGPYDWTDVYKFDYSNPRMREGMTDALRFWLAEAGIDGFRCDVASEVPVDFWNEVRPKLEAVKPDLFMLAEASVPALEEKAFDMAYNWPMKDLFSRIASTAGQYSFVADGQTEPRKFDEAHAADIPALNDSQIAQYPADSYMMNMITNHDLNSWEGTEFERLGNLTPAFAVLSYTLPGMPLIYTGQEVGMNRAFEFFEKDTAPDFTPNSFTDFYKRLNALKHSRRELAAGSAVGAPMKVFPTVNPDVLVFERRIGDSATIVGVNLGKAPAVVEFVSEKNSPKIAGTVDAFTGTQAGIPTALVPGGYFVITEN